MPFLLCPKCADHVTEAYLFQRLIQYSNEKLDKVLNKINSTLDLSKELRNNVQTLHFIMGASDSCIFTSRLSSSKTKQTVLSKVKSFLMHKKKQKNTTTRPAIQLICQDCGEIFSSKASLYKHMQRHSRKRYACRECAKLFKNIWSMKDHMDRIHSERKIQCPKCSKMLSTERLLQRHDDREHKAANCKLCFVQFPSKSALKQHMNRHGQYKCMVCEKLFLNRQSSQTHMKSCGKQEVKQRVYCDICNQSYNWKNALRTHLKVKHGFGDKIYSCDWCDKKFDAASRLKCHIVKHTKEKNFHCEKCGGRFVTQAALVYHTRLHTGETPFKCDLCEESFLSASRRMEHKKRKHFGPQKQCPFCVSKFITGHSLRNHIARHKNPQSKLFVGEDEDVNHKVKKVMIQIFPINKSQ